MSSVSEPRYRFFQAVQTTIADTITPIGAFLAVRDRSTHALYFEEEYLKGDEGRTSDQIGASVTTIATDALLIARLEADGSATLNGERLDDVSSGQALLTRLLSLVAISDGDIEQPVTVYGFSGFPEQGTSDQPAALYVLFGSVLTFKGAAVEIRCLHPGSEAEAAAGIALLRDRIFSPQAAAPQGDFCASPLEESDCSEAQFLQAVKRAQSHIKRGDIFQIVLSRAFSRRYQGDEFSLFRRLRVLSPAPYSYFLDAGEFKLFGASPELQVRIKNQQAEIHPIAGTLGRRISRVGTSGHKRSQQDNSDNQFGEAAPSLMDDPKERAEHMMLVDLARNDLSMHCRDVTVRELAKERRYSHVTHLVSVVRGRLRIPPNALALLFDSLPAGTLSGAPKKRALEIIRELESSPRGFYGGMIGSVTKSGDDISLSHAIIIRSVFARANQLHYRAGAGIVHRSRPEHELAEIDDKLAAIRETIFNCSEAA